MLGNMDRRLVIFVLWVSWLCNCGALMIHVPGNAEECFGVDLTSGDTLLGSWEAIPEDVHHLQVVVKRKDADKELFKQQNEVRGQFEVPVEYGQDSTGEHMVCFTNQEGRTIALSFTFRSQYEAQVNVATGDQMVELLSRISKAQLKLEVLLDLQEFTMTREAAHRKTAESTHSKVYMWTVVKVLTAVILSAVQIYYLRGFFESKTIV